MTSRLNQALENREKSGNLRQLVLNPSLIDFSSNDYLGMARSPHLAKLVANELKQSQTQLNGLGSTGSRLLTGNSAYAHDLEDNIAAFHGFEAGLIFNCGYMANLGLLSAIADTEDTIFFDTSVHASTRAGIRLSRAAALPFRHNDTEHLENRLNNYSSRKGDRFICVESIYSTDGSMSPLSDICYLAKKYNAYVIVDEAHAAGVSGPQGRGLVAEKNLCSSVFAQITTFGKAIGTCGAIVMGSHILKKALINFSSPYIYTTALPLYSLIAIKNSYHQFPEMNKERNHLQSLTQIFKLSFPHSSLTHIQSIPVKGNHAAKALAQTLLSCGIDARPLLSPTVQRGKEVIRICLHAFNTIAEVETLLNILKRSMI